MPLTGISFEARTAAPRAIINDAKEVPAVGEGVLHAIDIAARRTNLRVQIGAVDTSLPVAEYRAEQTRLTEKYDELTRQFAGLCIANHRNKI